MLNKGTGFPIIGTKMPRISGFYDNSCTNGDGWRSVIFFSGCPHRCYGCQNPETWDYNSGYDIDTETLKNKVLSNMPFIDGVTLSGGEPFQERHLESIIKLVDELKKESLNIWCYTGYKYEDLVNNPEFLSLLSRIDVLIDGKFEKDLYDPNLRFRGSSNQRVIDVKKSLELNRLVLYYKDILESA